MHTLLIAPVKTEGTCADNKARVRTKKETTMALLIRLLFQPWLLPARVVDVLDRCDKEFDTLNANLEEMASKGAP